MPRPKKKTDNPELSMEQLLSRAVTLFQEPYDDREGRDTAVSLPSLRSVADELGTTLLRARKLLITADYYSTRASRLVQALAAEGRSADEIMEATGLSLASINSYLPYKNLAFNLDQSTVNADRHKLFRRRAAAAAALETAMKNGTEEELALWKAIVAFENYPFITSGRKNTAGVKFTYTVSRSGGAGGRHYEGRGVEGYGNESRVATDGGEKKKSISRSTVDLAYRKARDLGTVPGPKALGIPGAGSYLYPIFLRLGVCRKEDGENV